MTDKLTEQGQVERGEIPDVDWLANVIRRVDGNHSLGAGALAEKIVDAMRASYPTSSSAIAQGDDATLDTRPGSVDRSETPQEIPPVSLNLNDHFMRQIMAAALRGRYKNANPNYYTNDIVADICEWLSAESLRDGRVLTGTVRETVADQQWKAYLERVRLGYAMDEAPLNFLGDVEQHRKWFMESVLKHGEDGK